MGIFSKKKKIEDKKIEEKKVGVKSDKVKGGSEKKSIFVLADKKEKNSGASMKDLYAEKTIEKAPKGKSGKKMARRYGSAHKVLYRPVITEKAANLGSENKYVFAVSQEANKIEIAKAILEVYGVKPVAVNIIKMHGKKVRTKRLYGKRKDWKKAVITLPEGKSIKVYEGV